MTIIAWKKFCSHHRWPIYCWWFCFSSKSLFKLTWVVQIFKLLWILGFINNELFKSLWIDHPLYCIKEASHSPTNLKVERFSKSILNVSLHEFPKWYDLFTRKWENSQVTQITDVHPLFYLTWQEEDFPNIFVMESEHLNEVLSSDEIWVGLH